MAEIEKPPQQTTDVDNKENENHKVQPADIEADMRDMERRKLVEAVTQSRLIREELERTVDIKGRECATERMQPLSPVSVFRSSNCVLPINDIRGADSIGYAKGEKILRCKLAATFRLLDLHGYTQCLGAQVTARLNADQELFLVNPSGLLSHEVTASSLNKVDMQGNVVQHGTTNFGINSCHYMLHSAVHAARPDIRCAIYINCSSVVAVSGLLVGLLPLTRDAAVLGEVSLHKYTGALQEPEKREKLIQSLGGTSKVLLLTNHGALCCGESIEEAFFAAYHIVQACETQLKMLPMGIENLSLIPEEERNAIYAYSRRPQESYETRADQIVDKENICTQTLKWGVGCAEFEALMRMLDNAGFRTGYIYRIPLVKFEIPKRRNNAAVSSQGEEKHNRQGTCKNLDMLKDCTRWPNSPNVYQKVVEVLETGTSEPKKITKWVADGTSKHSTAVGNENPIKFIPPGTNPKELKSLQLLIQENRRADKISGGPQSHILKTKSAKNPFESITDDEPNDYQNTVELKKHDDFTDTDVSESEGLSSLQISTSQPKNSSLSQSVDGYEPQLNRIETKIKPKANQPENSDEPLPNNHILKPRRLYVELEDPIAAKIKRTPRLDDLRQQNNSIDSTSGQNTSDFDFSGTSSDCITFVAQTSSPFRTVSHFGFKSPAKNPSPTHFHVPTECTKYVAVMTKMSIEELFATQKYLDYPDDLVPLLQRRKKLSRTIIRGRVERRRRSPPKQFAILHGYREYLVHGSGQQPHQSYIKMLEKYFIETPYIRRKTEEKRENFEKTVHALVTEMIDLAAELHTISEEASVDIDEETSDRGSICNTQEVESNLITDINSVIDSVPIMRKSVYDSEVLKPSGKLEVTSMFENFMQQLAETRFSNESPNLDYQPDEVISTPQSHSRSLLSRSNREARRAEFIELWEDHLDNASTRKRLASAEAHASLSKDQAINDITSNYDSMDNLDDTMLDLISTTTLAESSDSYEPIERTIIEKINLHRLDKDDVIFSKIKQTIYDHNNSKFEQTATNNQPGLTSPLQTSTPFNCSASKQKFTQNFKQAIPKLIDSHNDASAVKNTTKKRAVKESFAQKMKAINGYASSVTSDEEQSNTSRTQRKERNFIAENIKKVSARGKRELSKNSSDHYKPPLKSTKSSSAVKSFLKGSTKTGSSLLWLSVSATSTGSSNAALNDCTGNSQTASIDDLSKQHSEFSSCPSNEVSLTTVNRLLNEHIPTDESAEVLLQNVYMSDDVINAAVREINDLSSKNNETIGLVQKCSEHIASLRLDEIHLDMDEIFQIHNENIAEHAAERERCEAELAEDWQSYDRIAFSLSDEED